MIRHPLLQAVFVLDAMGCLLTLAAAWTALQVAVRWSPVSADRSQIRLEIEIEKAFYLATAGVALLALSTVVLIVALTNVLPALVPGAMCGTGVLAATRGSGLPALGLRLATLAVMGAWHVLERLNRSRPDSPLTPLTARVFLMGLPLGLLAAKATWDALGTLDIHQPVACCSIVYDQLRATAGGRSPVSFRAAWWLGAYAAGWSAVVLGGVWTWLVPAASRLRTAVGLAGVSLVWVPVAAVTLVDILSAYIFEVLNHPCPWCLFLPEHRWLGFPLFGLLGVVALEGPAACLTGLVALKFPEVRETALARSAAAGLRVVLAAGAFLLLSGLPPLLWRMRFGVWMAR